MNKFIAKALDNYSLWHASRKESAPVNHADAIISLIQEPPAPPRALARIPKPFLKQSKKKSFYEVYQYAFPSQVVTANAINNTVRGRLFKLTHIEPKSTVILLHSLYEKSYRTQERLAKQFLRKGHDCVVVSLPYHIERANPPQCRQQVISDNLHGLYESLQQSVKDVLALIHWLDDSGQKRIGLVGTQLGGLIAGIVASMTRKITYTVLVTPATNPAHIFDYGMESAGIASEQLVSVNKAWDLTAIKPLIPQERIFIVGAEHDALIPKSAISELWHAWGQPRLRFYKHGHISLRNAKKPLNDVTGFVQELFSRPWSIGLLK